MSFLTILRATLFFALALAVGWYAWRGFKKGRIMVGIRGNSETSMIRREDPISYWVVMFLFAVVVTTLLFLPMGLDFKLGHYPL